MHRTEVRSTFNLWVSLLSETRKMSRERAAFAEVMASEMTSRLDIMSKDVQMLTRKVHIMCTLTVHVHVGMLSHFVDVVHGSPFVKECLECV